MSADEREPQSEDGFARLADLDALDALTLIARDVHLFDGREDARLSGPHARRIARQVLAWLAARRPAPVGVVSSVEDALSLPIGTVLWSEGRSFERGGDFWGEPAFYAAGSEMPYKPAELLPARVLFRPDRESTVKRPEIVVLCGSTRFYDEFQQANYDLTMEGKIVLSVGFYPHSKAKHGHGEGVGHDSAEKVALDELHKRKIDLADRVFVLNVGGYVGESTRSEIEYAESLGRPIDYLFRPDREVKP